MFQILLLLNALIALRAVQLTRPATLFLAANQVLVLKALAKISSQGPPASQSFLPTHVFSTENLDTAAALLCLTTVVLIASTFARNREQSTSERPFPALPSWFVGLVVLYVIYRALQAKTVLSVAYADEAQQNIGLEFAGLAALFLGGLLYTIGRAITCSHLSVRQALMLVFAIFALTDFLKGATGIAAGMVGFSAVAYFGLVHRPAVVKIALIVVGLGLTTFVVRTVRASLHEEGVGAVTKSLSSLFGDDEGSSSVEAHEGLEGGLNGVQYASHLLECITLYDSGIRREWRSIRNPFIYTFMPSFLLEPLGLERPQDAPWELFEHFVHGGGIFLVGDLYWNGGFVCVALMWSLIVAFAVFCDTRYRAEWVWFAISCQFTSTLLMGVGYGFAQVFRGASNGLLTVAIIAIAPRTYRLIRERLALGRARGATRPLET